MIEDVGKDPRFGRKAAESTGYIPKGLMAVPLLLEERSLGVLEVLDRPQRSRFTLAEMDLLGLFAGQAAIALDLLQRARRAQSVLDEGNEDVAGVARIAEALDTLEGPRRDAGLRLTRSARGRDDPERLYETGRRVWCAAVRGRKRSRMRRGIASTAPVSSCFTSAARRASTAA